MALYITAELKIVLKTALQSLRGPARRLFMASVVLQLGRGGQRKAAAEFGWNRGVIRKGLHELRSGVICADAVHQRGRRPYEAQLPNLAADLRAIAEMHSETDPTFRTTQCYRRLTAHEARQQLIETRGYSAECLPSDRSLRRKLSALGFLPRKVAKSKPIKKIKETDAIFDQVHAVNRQADIDECTVRLSLDTKAVVAIGDVSRGGKSRQGEQVCDHDFELTEKITPFGIFRPDTNETWLFFTSGSVTADFMVDRLEEIWPEVKKTVILHLPW